MHSELILNYLEPIQFNCGFDNGFCRFVGNRGLCGKQIDVECNDDPQSQSRDSQPPSAGKFYALHTFISLHNIDSSMFVLHVCFVVFIMCRELAAKKGR